MTDGGAMPVGSSTELPKVVQAPLNADTDKPQGLSLLAADVGVAHETASCVIGWKLQH